MQEYEAIICGAGVGGLAMAVALGLQNRRVLLIEKQRTDPRIHKGEFLQPRTLYILDEWGALPILSANGALKISAMEARSAAGELFALLDYQLLPRPFNYGLAQYYHAIKQSLLARASRLVEIRYGTRIEDLTRTNSTKGNIVRIATNGSEQEVLSPLIVGADGRLSVVRNRIGIAVDMFEYPHQLLALDLAEVTHLKPHVINFITLEGLRVLYPLPENRARLYVQIPTGTFRDIKQQGAAWRRTLLTTTPGLEIVADQLPEDVSTMQLLSAWRFSAAQWAVPGVALLGDAAHCIHPAAGQGMNAAIADAWALAQVLQEEAGSAGYSPSSVNRALVRYDNGRRREFDYVATLSHVMSQICTSRSPFKQWVAQWSLRRNRRNRRLQYKVTYNMSGLGVYRFTLLDRLYQFGLLPDPRAERIGI